MKANILRTAGFHWVVVSRCPRTELLLTLVFRFQVRAAPFEWQCLWNSDLSPAGFPPHPDRPPPPVISHPNREVLSVLGMKFSLGWLTSRGETCPSQWAKSSHTTGFTPCSDFTWETSQTGTWSCIYWYYAKRYPKWFPEKHTVKNVIMPEQKEESRK